MKKSLLTLLFSFLLSSIFLGCNSSKPKVISNSAHQQVNNTRSFPRAAGEVVCHNCRATFKIAANMHKQTHGHNYVECPVCHHDYSKKSKQQ